MTKLKRILPGVCEAETVLVLRLVNARMVSAPTPREAMRAIIPHDDLSSPKDDVQPKPAKATLASVPARKHPHRRLCGVIHAAFPTVDPEGNGMAPHPAYTRRGTEACVSDQRSLRV